MPHLLFRLNGVPEDEVIEVRRLLDEHHVEYYETDAGRFGISLAAIWLRDEVDPAYATQLLETYQQQRYREARESYRQQQEEGTAETHLQRFLRQPLRSLLYLAVVLAILYFTLAPFLLHATH